MGEEKGDVRNISGASISAGSMCTVCPSSHSHRAAKDSRSDGVLGIGMRTGRMSGLVHVLHGDNATGKGT